MKFANMVLGALLGFLSLAVAMPASTFSNDRRDGYPLPPPGAIFEVVENRCNFDVYVRQTVAEHPSPRPWENCTGYGDSETIHITPGMAFVTQRPIWEDSCGHSIKVSRCLGCPVYQFEMAWARENGHTWYNLSHLDGNPFTDVDRSINGPDGMCPMLHWDPGNDGSQCDYPDQEDCGFIHNYIFGRLCWNRYYNGGKAGDNLLMEQHPWA